MKTLFTLMPLIVIAGCFSIKPVKNNTNSTIVLNGSSRIILKQGEPFNDPGAVAISGTGQKINIESFNNIDTSRVGTYGVTYSAIDDNGKRISIGRIVEVRGTNLLANKNPELFKTRINLYGMKGYTYSDESHTDDGSGCVMLKGQGKDVYGKAITTPPFHLEKGRRYTMSAYVKMVGAPRGQNIFFKISPRGNAGKTVEVLYNIAEPNEWEEAILPYRAEVSGNYVFQFLIHKYGYSTNGQLIKPDLSNMAESPTIYYDDFSVVESTHVVSREPYTEKIPFESSTVRIDELGNWSVKENGKWKNIFPRFAYQTWLPDFAENAKRYKDYGFTGYANIDSIQKLKIALDTGLKYNAVQINKMSDKTEKMIIDINHEIDNKKLPADAVIMYQYDNENAQMSHYAEKNSIAARIDKNDKDPVTGKRRRPIFVLNGVGEGLARNMKNSHCNFMDLTGSYVGQNGEDTDIRYNPVNTLEMLDKIDKQKAPVSIIQMQAYYHKTFIPMLFKGIIQGGKGLKFWRGGTTHNGSKKDFRENYWAPAVKGKDGVFAKIDEMLPIIREPLPNDWTAIIPQEQTDTIAIGTRSHNGKHYLILANFADKDQTVKIALGGIYAVTARDYFTGQKISSINEGTFSVEIGHFNNGYKVLELEP